MKLGTVEHDGQQKVVAVVDDMRLLDLSADYPDMVALVQAGPDALTAIKARLADPDPVIALQDVTIRCPIMPVQYRDALAHELHMKNCYDRINEVNGTNMTIPPVFYEQPIYYKGNRMSFIGQGEVVQWPAYSDWMDLELELAVIIGTSGQSISEDAAPNHIFGYTILNDMSARDAQMKETPGGLGPAKGKDFDTGNILGPWIVTADEIPHPADLQMDVTVNGDRWGGGRSSEMLFSFAQIIAHVSASETLHAGEVIGSGTVGTGTGLELGKKLADGDSFTLTIEKIGSLTNEIRKS